MYFSCGSFFPKTLYTLILVLHTTSVLIGKKLPFISLMNPYFFMNQSNTLHFLSIFLPNKPLGIWGEHFHVRRTFHVFSQHPEWVIMPVNLLNHSSVIHFQTQSSSFLLCRFTLYIPCPDGYAEPKSSCCFHINERVNRVSPLERLASNFSS